MILTLVDAVNRYVQDRQSRAGDAGKSGNDGFTDAPEPEPKRERAALSIPLSSFESLGAWAVAAYISFRRNSGFALGSQLLAFCFSELYILWAVLFWTDCKIVTLHSERATAAAAAARR